MYPKTVTTNDGLMMYFDSYLDHITAYDADPRMFMEKPVEPEKPFVGIDIDAPVEGSDPQSVSIAKSFVPQRRRPGRPRRDE